MAKKKILLRGANRWQEWPEHNAALSQVISEEPVKA
jgi:hypothetical protein